MRKAAFECMYTLLEKCIDRLDIFEFLSHVQDGLKDHYDIKVKLYFAFLFHTTLVDFNPTGAQLTVGFRCQAINNKFLEIWHQF